MECPGAPVVELMALVTSVPAWEQEGWAWPEVLGPADAAGVTPAGALTEEADLPALALYTRCDEQRCALLVVEAVVEAGGASRWLPGTRGSWAVDGVRVDGLARADIDGDGRSEVLIRYSVAEPPRAAVGSWVVEHLVVVDPRRLHVRLDEVVREGGGLSEILTERSLFGGPGGVEVRGVRGIRGDLESGLPGEVLPSRCRALGRHGRYRR